MIEKVSFSSVGKTGSSIYFNTGKELVKQASNLIPEVEKFAEKIIGDAQHVWILVHAIGAGEAYGANRNGDYTSIEALNNVPEDWTGDPTIDRVISRTWQYGWPTYYNAYVFASHVNKDPKKNIGSVEFVTWNPHMLRVELILKINRERAQRFGAGWAIKRLDDGRLVDVSMGMRVPFDLSERHIDWDKYKAAVAAYDAAVHPSVGAAVLAYHHRDPIPGLSITREDYPEETKLAMNKVYPDGSKNFVHNTFPRFFDISAVFLGAEKPAKAMHKFASQCKLSGIKCAQCKGKHCVTKVVPPSAYVMDLIGGGMPKQAASKEAGNKVGRLLKKSEIKKKTPASFGQASVSAMAEREEDLPKEILDRLGEADADRALSTPSMLGMKLKPREFQRIVLIRIGKKPLADDLDAKDQVFSTVNKVTELPDISHNMLSPVLTKLLLPFMGARSCFSPFLQKRVEIVIKSPEKEQPEEKTDTLLDKISAAYNGYCKSLIKNFEKEATLALHQNLMIREAVFGTGLVKQSSPVIDKFSLEYLKG